MMISDSGLLLDTSNI